MDQPQRPLFVVITTYHLPKLIGTRQLSASSLEYLDDQSAQCIWIDKSAPTYKSLFEKCAILVFVVNVN